MRAIMILAISFSLLNIISAQENADLVYEKDQNEIKTLFGDHKIVHGGYGAFSFGYSEIENLNSVTIGGRGAWIIGHWFALGFAGSGFISDVTYNYALGQDVNISGGYGGILLEPIILPWFPVHISVPVLLGAGGIAYITSYGYDEEYEPPTWIEDATSFLIMEPGAELEFNFIKYFRLSLGVTYRMTTDINLNEYTSSYPLNGWTGMVTLKFGKF
jgi:hypothetical protein